MPYLPSATGDLADVGVLLVLLFPVWFGISLFYNLKTYRFAFRHPELPSAVSLSRLKARCITFGVLLALCLGLGLWWLLPRSMDYVLDLEPQQVTATYREPVVVDGAPKDQTLTLGPLEGEDAAPLLAALDHVALRPDFRDLLPMETEVDTRLTGGRVATVILTDNEGRSRSLTFYGTHLLTVEGDGPLRRYGFYDPLQGEEVLRLLQRLGA